MWNITSSTCWNEHATTIMHTYFSFELITTVTTVTKLLKMSFSRDSDAMVSLPEPPPPGHQRQPYLRVRGQSVQRCCFWWCCYYRHSPDARTPCRCRQWRQWPLKLYKYILLYRLHRRAWVGTRESKKN